MDKATFSELKALYDARPFRPFEVVLDDGRRLLVDEPYFIGWSTRNRTINWSNHQDTIDVIPMTSVAAVKRLGATRRPNKRNGSMRRGGDH
jgi:hypothetical protein